MGPYLALPVLKSYLQEVEQYKVDIVDLNVEFYDDLLSNMRKPLSIGTFIRARFQPGFFVSRRESPRTLHV